MAFHYVSQNFRNGRSRDSKKMKVDLTGRQLSLVLGLHFFLTSVLFLRQKATPKFYFMSENGLGNRENAFQYNIKQQKQSVMGCTGLRKPVSWNFNTLSELDLNLT